tara:strand:- start:1658 stop:2131 length:474 start_codon:yes stop_codon:yes gene_type:complete
MKYILIKKNGDVEEKISKNPIKIEELYKFCKYKNDTNFEKLHNYSKDDKSCLVYGKKAGRANSENKYEFPPPIDKDLFFGNLCIIQMKKDEIIDITKKEWNAIYEKLFGGFEDIEHSDGERSCDSTVYSDDEYTKEGYHKNSFVIDDDEELTTEEYV